MLGRLSLIGYVLNKIMELLEENKRVNQLR
jgi:hypothetical protein